MTEGREGSEWEGREKAGKNRGATSKRRGGKVEMGNNRREKRKDGNGNGKEESFQRPWAFHCTAFGGNQLVPHSRVRLSLCQLVLSSTDVTKLTGTSSRSLSSSVSLYPCQPPLLCTCQTDSQTNWGRVAN